MMLPTFVSLLATFALASAQSSPKARHAEPEKVPNTFFVRLHNPPADSRADPKAAFHRQVAEKSVAYNVRYEYSDSDLFYGMSVSLADDKDIETLKTIPEVDKVFPVRWIQRPELESSFSTSAAFDNSLHKAVRSSAGTPTKRAADVDFNSPHRLTGVDEAHAAGIKGAGVKVAIIDSGVDWRHPALGGCFGAGCKVSFGYDLIGDDYSVQNPVPSPKPDPLTTCLGGFHGTHVSGIVGMEAPANETLFSGLVGVAPEAELGMYRVFGCSSYTSEDVIIAGMQRAANDGAHVISMSLGGAATWGHDPSSPFLDLIAGLKRRGVAVVAAAGNTGESTPFYLSSPAIIPDALAVASVENSQFPTYEVRDSAGQGHRYGSLYPFPSGNYTAVLTGNGTARTEFGCLDEDYAGLLETLTGDLSRYVLVVRRGWCPVSVTQNVAQANGFTKILTIPDPDSDDISIDGYGVPVVAFNGNGTMVSFGSMLDSKIYDGVKASKDFKLSFAEKTPALDDQPWGGQINNFSSVGPSWDFSLKPQISAPGGSILATYPLGGGGWAIVSGTSMATPYLSGVYALVKSKYPDLSVDGIFDRIKTTAKPVIQTGYDGYSPTPQQGAGLVSASSALFYETTASPGQFELFGTETLAKLDTNITLHNPSSSAVTYTLDHVPANGMAFFPYGNSAPDGAGWIDPAYLHLTPLPFAASLKFSSASVTVPAGGSEAVAFTVVPPAGLDPKEIPVYSGYVTATSAAIGETLSIPYVGAPYNYTAAELIGLDPPTANISDPARSVFAAPQAYHYATKLAQGDYAQYTFLNNDYPAFRYSLLQATQWTRVDVIAAETAADLVPTYYGYDPTHAVANFTRTVMQPNGTVAGVLVLGNLFLWSGDYPLVEISLPWTFPLYDVTGQHYIGLKRGGYRLLVQWLRFGGDETRREDWTSWVSGVIEITRDAYAAPGENATVV